MSSQLGGSIILPNSFNPNRDKLTHYRSKSIDSSNLASWAETNMYKSTYAQYHSKDSTQSKSGAIPGYQGFIPQNRSESLHGKRFTSLTKQVFGNSGYGKNQTGLNSNGFNIQKQSFIDYSKTGSTSKYGRTSWLQAHPAWQANQWKSTTQDTYLDPKSHVDPNYRESSRNSEYLKKPALSSGFATNRAYGDGKGWNPQKILQPQNKGSEYRNIYNPEQQIHRDANISKLRNLKKPESNYKFNL